MVDLTVQALAPIVVDVRGEGISLAVEETVTHVEIGAEPAASLCVDTAHLTLVAEPSEVSISTEVHQVLALVIPADQGPAGPSGNGSGPAAEPALRTDFADPRHWYVEYASRIKRLDHAVSPAEVGFAVGDWADREGLPYG